MTDKVPLPLPARYPEEGASGIDYTADQMHAYAAEVSAADNAALREQVRVLREALQAASDAILHIRDTHWTHWTAREQQEAGNAAFAARDSTGEDMSDTVPLPEPVNAWHTKDGYKAYSQWHGPVFEADQMHAYADAKSAAECAPLVEEIEALRRDGSTLTARVRVLEDALREYIAAADYSTCGSDDVTAMLRFGEADKVARAALEQTK